jgi:hypothetical protein
MMDADKELDGLPPFEPDPRIGELVEYAVSGVELILNAEFLLDCWVTAYLKRNAYTAHLYRQFYMPPEQKFVLAAEESGLAADEEFGDREAYGFLLDLYRLRARAGRLADEELTQSLIEAYVRHGGEEAEECWLPLNLARQVVAGHLAYAEAWFSVCTEDIPYLYDDEPVEDLGWESRGGGSCNFVSE